MGRYISQDVKRIVLRMSLQHHISDTLISESTDVGRRMLRRLRKTYRDSGDVVRKPAVTGRPRTLDGLDAVVCTLPSRVKLVF